MNRRNVLGGRAVDRAGMHGRQDTAVLPKRAARGIVRMACRDLSAVVLLLLGITASAWAAEAVWTAPQPPVLKPVIRRNYANDSDGNRIDDELEDRITVARAARDPSGVVGKAARREQVDQEQIGVELIFSEPVRQSQIDAFIALGGQIDYVYKAVSYGWHGRIKARDIPFLIEPMGSSLVQIAPEYEVGLYMDVASQIGRVRPIWRSGFAENAAGFHGDPNTTIAFIDSGLDDTHSDLVGRGVHWNDVSADADPHPIDYDGHGSAVAGVALGTGLAGGDAEGQLRLTYVSSQASWAHVSQPIALPVDATAVTSHAYWKGSSAWLDHVLWRKGTDMGDLRWIGGGQQGEFEASYVNVVDASEQDVFSAVLANWLGGTLNAVAIVNSVLGYPGVGDGYNTFRGVAPGCRWAASKLYAKDGRAFGSRMAVAIDDLVVNRIDKNIKIINISSGLQDSSGFPMRNEAIRDKVTSATHNGILIVVAAGNSGDEALEARRTMADPAGAGVALTVGAANDENRLTSYSTYGFGAPQAQMAEDYKPDLIAPGGSFYHTGVISVDSGSYDVYPRADREPNDYTCAVGTSLASPFVAGCAALVIEAMTRQGIQWDFQSDRHPRYVKMLLCATASETNAARENGQFDPTLERASQGPQGFPEAKDPYEGYGLVNPDAAVEAVCLLYTPGEVVLNELGSGASDQRVWARTVDLTADQAIEVLLINPAQADFDLYLYSAVPSDMGTPVVLASSTDPAEGGSESISYTPDSDEAVLLVVKRVSGSGTFELRPVQSNLPVSQVGPTR